MTKNFEVKNLCEYSNFKGILKNFSNQNTRNSLGFSTKKTQKSLGF